MVSLIRKETFEVAFLTAPLAAPLYRGELSEGLRGSSFKIPAFQCFPVPSYLPSHMATTLSDMLMNLMIIIVMVVVVMAMPTFLTTMIPDTAQVQRWALPGQNKYVLCGHSCFLLHQPFGSQAFQSTIPL